MALPMDPPTVRSTALNATALPVSSAGTTDRIISGITTKLTPMPSPCREMPTTTCHSWSWKKARKAKSRPTSAGPKASSRDAAEQDADDPVGHLAPDGVGQHHQAGECQRQAESVPGSDRGLHELGHRRRAREEHGSLDERDGARQGDRGAAQRPEADERVLGCQLVPHPQREENRG